MILSLYNSRTRQKDIFKPIDEQAVRLYVCGPTVYNKAHIGNARSVVVFDVLVRLLRHIYPRVIYVRNITDVDDKINDKAAKEKVPIKTIAQKYEKQFHKDMAQLLVLPPDIEPRATEHIQDMIDFIKMLVKKGHAYEAEGAGAGHILFSVKTDKAYGSLSNRKIDDMKAGARVRVEPYKKNAGDFVLWKPSKKESGLPSWDSPWGRGRPGWHIECSAMIRAHLAKKNEDLSHKDLFHKEKGSSHKDRLSSHKDGDGDKGKDGFMIDIHGGGQDLQFPHHENECAQTRCAYGQELANVWMHNGMLQLDGEKMSKSLGNIWLVDELLQHMSGEAVRLALLQTHYRKRLDFSYPLLERAMKHLDRFYDILGEESFLSGDMDMDRDKILVGKGLVDKGLVDKGLVDKGLNDKGLVDKNLADKILVDALCDDLNTPLALSRLFALGKELGIARAEGKRDDVRQKKVSLLASGALLGLLQSDPADWQKSRQRSKGAQQRAHATEMVQTNEATQIMEIEGLIRQRDEARKQKDFSRADELRKALDKLDVLIEDTPKGTKWRRK